MILAIIFIFVSVLAMALGPYFVGLAINTIGDIFSHGITDELKYYFILFIILSGISYLIACALMIISQNIISSVTQTTMYELRKEIDVKLHRLPLNYYDTTTYGDILSRLTNDVSVISDSIFYKYFYIIKYNFYYYNCDDNDVKDKWSIDFCGTFIYTNTFIYLKQND